MNVIRRLVPLVVGVVLLACEDDATGPSNLELAFIAHNFAELGRSREDAGDITGAVASANATLALRSGIRPSRVSITVDGVTEEYRALEVERSTTVVRDAAGYTDDDPHCVQRRGVLHAVQYAGC